MIRVVAIKTGYDNVTVRQPGDTFDVADDAFDPRPKLDKDGKPIPGQFEDPPSWYEKIGEHRKTKPGQMYKPEQDRPEQFDPDFQPELDANLKERSESLNAAQGNRPERSRQEAVRLEQERKAGYNKATDRNRAGWDREEALRKAEADRIAEQNRISERNRAGQGNIDVKDGNKDLA